MIIDGRELSLIYDINRDEQTYALHNVDISIETGEFVGIMGPSGSGKSSLLYILSGLKKPTTGTVYYNDIDVESLTPVARDGLRKEKFGFIFQRHFLLDYLSVLDNVLAAVNKSDYATRSKAVNLLEKLGIKHLAAKKPSQLSGGQRQRAAVARALINDPEVIFADEPTASLDHGNARDVMEVLREFKSHTALMVVTHDRSILDNADRVVEMWDGRATQKY